MARALPRFSFPARAFVVMSSEAETSHDHLAGQVVEMESPASAFCKVLRYGLDFARNDGSLLKIA